MKFLIKTSAIGVSDKKFAKQGEYETEDKKEIERLKDVAKRFPDDVEEIKSKEASKPNAQKKDDDKSPEDPKDPEDKTPKDDSKKDDPKDDPKKADGKPANNSKK